MTSYYSVAMNMLDRFHTLRSGIRVRLRLARSSDVFGLRELLERTGSADRLEAVTLIRFDPRRRIVICASMLIDARETIVGVGAVDLVPGGPLAPSTLVVDERVPGLRELLADVLEARASALLRTTAA